MIILPSGSGNSFSDSSFLEPANKKINITIPIMHKMMRRTDRIQQYLFPVKVQQVQTCRFSDTSMGLITCSFESKIKVELL